jgi:CheY-like chemotaxis protein
MNLAANGRDAMPGGGKLTIGVRRTRLDAGGPARPAGAPAGEYVVVSVRDTGTGMDAEVKRHLFEPFFTTKGPGHGTGLGLATSYAIVQQNGGFFRVESAPGAGTLMEIYWPRAEALETTATSEAAAAAVVFGHETILLVEDEPELRAIVSRSLLAHGYQVLEAENGEHALQVAESHPGVIDLLLTDIVMPRLGGQELAKRLLAVRPRLPVLFMSGYVQDWPARDGLTGEWAFLAKPFYPAALVARVREVLDQRRDPGTGGV